MRDKETAQKTPAQEADRHFVGKHEHEGERSWCWKKGHTKKGYSKKKLWGGG